MLGAPDEIVEVGKTQIPFEIFMEHLQELATTTFRGECYHLMDHNCNTFSNELALFLTGNPIPAHITNLPQEVLSTPFGAMIKPFLDSMQVNPGGSQVFPGSTSSNLRQSAAANSSAVNTSKGNQYFPKTTFLSFETANIKSIIGKLKELNKEAPAELQEREILLEQLEGLAECKENRLEQLNSLQKIIQWPANILFPVLDILRLSMRNQKVNQYFCDSQHAAEYLELLLTNLSCDKPPANQMLCLRTICNTFLHSCGEAFLVENVDKVMEALIHCSLNLNKNIQIAASSVMLNFAVVFHKQYNVKAAQICLAVVDMIAAKQTEPEANFRLLVCIGTFISGDKSYTEFIKTSTSCVVPFVKKCLDIKDISKVNECASFILRLL